LENNFFRAFGNFYRAFKKAFKKLLCVAFIFEKILGRFNGTENF
jgi:hypothetical protein